MPWDRNDVALPTQKLGTVFSQQSHWVWWDPAGKWGPQVNSNEWWARWQTHQEVIANACSVGPTVQSDVEGFTYLFLLINNLFLSEIPNAWRLASGHGSCKHLHRLPLSCSSFVRVLWKLKENNIWAKLYLQVIFIY